MTRAAATRNRRGIIPRLTEINSSLPPQPANVPSTPRLQTPQTAAGTKPQIILLSNLLDHVAVV
jgi:hypothetical protein